MKSQYHKLYMLALLLVVIGGFNWGFIGAFNMNPVKEIVKKLNLKA